jgi:phosphoribosylaminoimidazole-succinocarboxamide synthase
VESDRLPKPIFTPSTKAESGHDENISFEEMSQLIGPKDAASLRDLSVGTYEAAAEHARTRGIIICDTKFEWGRLGSEIILADEVLTPDSSRFWPAESYKPGQSQPSYDKQFVRDYLETCTWDKTPPPPALPQEVIAKTRLKYVEAYERLTGRKF